MSTSSSARCQLLELPAELRLQVLENLFENWKDHWNCDQPEPGGGSFEKHGVMRLRANRNERLVSSWRYPRPGILLTCKQLRREATDVFYEKTLFFHHMNRPSGGFRCDGFFLDGPVQNLVLHVRAYYTRELENAIGRMKAVLEAVPEKRKYTAVGVWLYAFNNYERMRRDKTFPPEDCDQAWLAVSVFLRLELGCRARFTLDRSWQRALGPARLEQLRQKADVSTYAKSR